MAKIFLVIGKPLVVVFGPNYNNPVEVTPILVRKYFSPY